MNKMKTNLMSIKRKAFQAIQEGKRAAATKEQKPEKDNERLRTQIEKRQVMQSKPKAEPKFAETPDSEPLKKRSKENKKINKFSLLKDEVLDITTKEAPIYRRADMKLWENYRKRKGYKN